MSLDTLSAVLERLIRSLCLRDFPCGKGGWRKKKEEQEAAEEAESVDDLLDLLSCPHSPWRLDETWSPQAAALRQLAVLSPERLHSDFIYSYFTTLRIVNWGLSVVDEGLLKFSRLEELVLSANKISELPAENLPVTLRTLELCGNRLSSLRCLTSRPPPRLQHLGLSGNCLGSSEDACYLTGRQWPQLVSLDLSDCDYQEQQALLKALTSLPRLRSLFLEGNPLTLTHSYPGLTVDSLPLLSCLDSSWISPEERHRFRGLAKMSDQIGDVAAATVSVGRIRGIPDPATRADEKAPDFPVVTYSYFITYEFLSHRIADNRELNSETKLDAASAARVAEGGSSDTELQSDCDTEASGASTEETCSDTARVCEHSTQGLPWSECMDFSHAQTHTVRSLRDLKKFLNQGLCVRLEEEKVLSWPAAPDESSVVKSGRTVKEKKGGKEKESPVKSVPSKEKKKKCAPELVQDPPVRSVLSSALVPLQSLVRGAQRVSAVCDLGALHSLQPETTQKEVGKKSKEDKKKEEKDSKQRGGSGQKNAAAAKGRVRREQDADVQADDGASALLEPVAVELRVELLKMQSACELLVAEASSVERWTHSEWEVLLLPPLASVPS